MTTASCPLAKALWGARFAGVWLPSCYTTWGDTTHVLLVSVTAFLSATKREHALPVEEFPHPDNSNENKLRSTHLGA